MRVPKQPTHPNYKFSMLSPSFTESMKQLLGDMWHNLKISELKAEFILSYFVKKISNIKLNKVAEKREKNERILQLERELENKTLLESRVAELEAQLNSRQEELLTQNPAEIEATDTQLEIPEGVDIENMTKRLEERLAIIEVRLKVEADIEEQKIILEKRSKELQEIQKSTEERVSNHNADVDAQKVLLAKRAKELEELQRSLDEKASEANTNAISESFQTKALVSYHSHRSHVKNSYP